MHLVLQVLAIISITFTFLPLWRTHHWFVRGQHYLKAFYLVINAVLFLVLSLVTGFTFFNATILLGLLVATCWCIYYILPYTFLGKKSVSITSSEIRDRHFTTLIFNVYQDNDDFDSLLKKVREINPEIIFLLETDQKWDHAMSPLHATYPYHISAVRDDTYGLILFSKIPFDESSINYLYDDDTPSAEVLLRVAGQPIRIFGLHPKPPIPKEETTSKPKDVELLTAAYKIASTDKGEWSMLIGDLNDVAWSKVSTAVLKISGMVDPRRGRGFYATFPTYFPLKIPLDHVFFSPSFELLEFHVEENIGSDHYPMVITLQVPEK